MQNFPKDLQKLNSLPIISIATLTMVMATLMFLSFFLTSIPNAI